MSFHTETDTRVYLKEMYRAQQSKFYEYRFLMCFLNVGDGSTIRQIVNYCKNRC